MQNEKIVVPEKMDPHYSSYTLYIPWVPTWLNQLNGSSNIPTYHLFFWYPLVIFYQVLINYVVHSKLELKFPSQKLPCTSRSTIEIKAWQIH